MQHRSSHRQAVAATRKRCIRRLISAQETYAAKSAPFVQRNLNAQPLQRSQPVGKKSLATSFINRRLAPIGNDDAKSTLPRRNRRGQPRRPSADYENIRRLWKSLAHLYEFFLSSHHFSKSNSEQNPGPIAAKMPNVPGSGRRFFITSSSTTSTDVEDKFPPLFRQSHEASSSPLCRSSAAAVASRTFGPPVCSTQLPISARVCPRSARNASTSRPTNLRPCSRQLIAGNDHRSRTISEQSRRNQIRDRKIIALDGQRA